MNPKLIIALLGCIILGFFPTQKGFGLTLSEFNDWEEGYVITKSEDTLSGFVKRNRLYYQEIIYFKDGETGRKTTFTSGDILRFSCGGDIYTSFFIPEIPTPNKVLIPSQKESGTYIFVKALAEGKYDMLAYEYSFNNLRKPRRVLFIGPDNKNLIFKPRRFAFLFHAEKRKLKRFFKEEKDIRDFLKEKGFHFWGFVSLLRKKNGQD